jgi:hypothetical protein
MKSVRFVACIVIALMGANMANVALRSGFDHGVGFDTFLAGARDPWQQFIDNDLVSGLLFSIGWIIFRERAGRAIDTVAWVWMALWWGNIVVAVYVLVAARQSAGDAKRFFFGRTAGPLTSTPLTSASRIASGALAIGVAVFLGIEIVRVAPAAVPVFGYIAGFVPLILSLALLATPRS